MYIDASAIIVQADGDGGDSLQREGMHAFGMWLRYQEDTHTLYLSEPKDRQDPYAIMSRFETAPGLYVRHPDPKKWYSNPWTTSRDQLVPVIAFCAAYKDYPRLYRLFKTVGARGFFAQNYIKNGDGKTETKVPDTFLMHLALWVRAGGPYTEVLRPLLYVLDTWHLLGTLLRHIPLYWSESDLKLRWKEPRDVDDNNVIIYHLVAAHFKPTAISWLDRQLYAWIRRHNFGVSLKGESNRVMGALVWYHREDLNGNPEMAELYRPLVEEYFSPKQQLRTTVQSLRSIASQRD